MRIAALLLVASFAAPLATADASDRWLRPVPGGVVEAFAYDGRPYAAGRHRGVDLATRPGAAVRTPCAGRVAFAGPVPRHRRAVTIRCRGGLTATVLGLGRTAAREGATVARGAAVGTVAGRSVHLGARRTGRRHAYLDPLALVGAATAPPPGALVPAGPRGRTPLPEPAAPPARPRPARAPDVAPAPGTPLAAWLGLALLAAGTPAGALLRRRRRTARRALAASRAAEGAR